MQHTFIRARGEQAVEYYTVPGGWTPPDIVPRYGDVLINPRVSEANRVWVGDHWDVLAYDNSGVGCVARDVSRAIEDPVEFYRKVGTHCDFEYVELDPAVHRRPEVDLQHVQIWFAILTETIHFGPLTEDDPLVATERPNGGEGVKGAIQRPGWMSLSVRW
ncbi:MAG: hypothetical protein WC700_07660 [Gemmatimonadaceae bacterium]|jgi:hypothetical protein